MVFLKHHGIDCMDDEIVAYIFQCSKMTVFRSRNEDINQKKKKSGPSSLLINNETNQIINWIEKGCAKMNPPDRRKLTQKIQNLLENEGKQYKFSKNWIDGLILRNSDRIKKIRARPMQEDRINVNESCVRDWFDLLSHINIMDIDPSLIINLDETGFGSSESSNIPYKKVITPSTVSKEVFFSVPRESKHISLICSITACGEALKPGIIGYNKNLSADSEKTTHFNNILYYYSKTAFINSMIYHDYLEKVIFPYVKERRIEIGNLNARSVLIIDGHLSHVKESIKTLCAMHNIDYLIIPPHSSHIIQPLDLCFFSSLKTNYRQSNYHLGFSAYINKIE